MPSTKTGIVTMEAMPHSKYHPTYFCTFVPAPIRRLQSRHVFCVAALLGGCSRPHVLPFHSLSVGLTLPFDEGPHFPCSRSREMESSCRCCDGMVAWGDRPLPIPCHLASPAPSRPGAVLVKLTPGPTAAPTQIPVCTSKQEGVWWEIADYMPKRWIEHERGSPRYSVRRRCCRSA